MGYQELKNRLEKTGRTRRHFDMSKHVLKLLDKAANENRMSRVAFLEHLIRRHCEPEKLRKNDVF